MAPVKKDLIPNRQIDLVDLLVTLAEVLGTDRLTAYLFGSRKDKTGSVRSDVDVLVTTDRPISQSEAARVWELEPYLDVFWMKKGEARSIVNESVISAGDDQELINTLGAVLLMHDGSWVAAAEEFRFQNVLSERAPSASIVPMYELTALPAERADLLVVTALDEEFQAAVRALDADVGGSHAIATIEDLTGESWTVRVTNIREMGSVGAALVTQEALRRTKARDVILVGLCAGIPGRAEIGEVIIPRAIMYYEQSKLIDDGSEASDYTVNCSAEVAARIGALRQPTPVVRSESIVMACGEKVVSSAGFREILARKHRKLAGIDMESYGVVRAAERAGRRVTVIKAVCDLADSSKSDSHHQEARDAAADVLVQAIRNRAFVIEGA